MERNFVFIANSGLTLERIKTKYGRDVSRYLAFVSFGEAKDNKKMSSYANTNRRIDDCFRYFFLFL